MRSGAVREALAPGVAIGLSAWPCYWADAFRPHCWVLYVKYEPALLSRMLMYWFVATCRFGFWYSARVTNAFAMMASCWLSRSACFCGSSVCDIWLRSASDCGSLQFVKLLPAPLNQRSWSPVSSGELENPNWMMSKLNVDSDVPRSALTLLLTLMPICDRYCVTSCADWSRTWVSVCTKLIATASPFGVISCVPFSLY